MRRSHPSVEDRFIATGVPKLLSAPTILVGRLATALST